TPAGPADLSPDRGDVGQPVVVSDDRGLLCRAEDAVKPSVSDPGGVTVERLEVLIRCHGDGPGPRTVAPVEAAPGDVPVDREVHVAGAGAGAAAAGVAAGRAIVVDWRE